MNAKDMRLAAARSAGSFHASAPQTIDAKSRRSLVKEDLSPLIGVMGLAPIQDGQVSIVQLAKRADDPALAILAACPRRHPLHFCSLGIHQDTPTPASSATGTPMVRTSHPPVYFSFTTFRISTSDP